MFRNFVDFFAHIRFARAFFKKRFNHNSRLRQLHHKLIKIQLIFVSVHLFFVVICMYVCSYYIKFIFRFLKKTGIFPVKREENTIS